jgi:protease-4
LWDLTEAIRTGATDARVQALLIDTDEMGSSGMTKLEELASAIATFKKSGKKVIARGSSFTQGDYYLAAQADELYLDPQGQVLLTGFGRYTQYLKDALDKLKVDMHLYRTGKYKTAAESYTRSDMSAADREETLVYVQALWDGYRTAVGAARKLTPQQITDYIEQLGASATKYKGDFATLAKDSGLVTALKTAAQVDQRMVELVGHDADSDDPEAFPVFDSRDYLRITRTARRLGRNSGDAVGVVIASGEILDGEQAPGTIGGVSTADQLRSARLDEDIKSVVLRVNSPGGSSSASEQIYREVVALKTAGKPVVVSMGDYAASGGYYIAAPADEIVASPNTVTGSIGVYFAFPTVTRSLDAVGVHTDGVGTTSLTGVLDLTRPVTPLVDQVLQAGVDHTYETFLSHVAGGRSKTRDEIDALAQGRVWAGNDALRLGLIDRTGNYQDALDAAAKRAKLPTGYRVKHVEPELNMAQRLLMQLQSRMTVWLRAAGLGSSAMERWAARLQPVERELRRIERLSSGNRKLLYCFCSVE